MAKLLYFTAGVIPTATEAAEIAKLEAMNTPAYDVMIRNGASDSDYEGGIETVDLVAGTIPTAYNGETALAVIHDDKPVAFDVWPKTAAVAALATFQLYPVSVTGDDVFNLTTANVEATTTYGTSDATKATVDANGLITGVAAGAATITATHTYASGKTLTATCAVTVS